MRVYARVYDCGQIVIRTHDQDQDQHTTGHGTPPEHTAGTQQPEKGGTREARKQNLRFSGDPHTINKKKLKKVWK